MRRYVSILTLICLFMLTGCESDSSRNATVSIPSATPQAVTEAPELKAARAWLSAVTNLDGNTILKYTCLEQRDNIQEVTVWTAALPILGSVLVGQDVKVQGDVSDIRLETTAKTDSFAEVYASGELRMAVSAMADARQIDEQWYMVYENNTWRWCGSLAGDLSLPIPAHVSQIPAEVSIQPSQSIAENSDIGANVTTSEELEKYVVGLWLDEAFANSSEVGDILIGLAFFPDGRIVDLDGDTGTYRAIDNQTIEATTTDWTERLIFEIIDSSTAAIYPSSSPSERTTAKRTVANTSTGDVSQDIIGEWEEIGLMFGTRGPIPEFGIQFSFSGNASGTMSGEALAAELGTNSASFNYIVGDKKIVGLLSPLRINSPVDVYSLGDFLFLSLQNEQMGFTKFLQRVGERPTTNFESIPSDEIGQSIVGVWKYRSHDEDEKALLATYPFLGAIVFTSNGFTTRSQELDGLQPYSYDNNGNLTWVIMGDQYTSQVKMPSQDVLVVSTTISDNGTFVQAMNRMQIPHKQLTGDLHQDILGTWTASLGGKIIILEFLPSGYLVVSERIFEDETGDAPSTINYEWIGEGRIRAEIGGESEVGVSFVDDLLILEMTDYQSIGFIWSE